MTVGLTALPIAVATVLFVGCENCTVGVGINMVDCPAVKYASSLLECWPPSISINDMWLFSSFTFELTTDGCSSWAMTMILANDTSLFASVVLHAYTYPSCPKVVPLPFRKNFSYS